jgi:hypothetical protein
MLQEIQIQHPQPLHSPPPLLLPITAANVSSANATTTASVVASGGTPGYTYALDAGVYQSGTSFSNVT